MLNRFFRFLIISLLFISSGCANVDSLQNETKTTLGYTKAYVIGQNYKDAISLFRNANFIDIDVLRLEDEKYKNYRNGEVIDIKIGELDDFDENTSVSYNDKVVISYVVNEPKINTLASESEINSIKDFKLFKASDHLIFNDSNDLGWEETWTITIEAEPNNLDWQDFSYEYNEDMIDVKALSLHYDDQKTYLAFEVKSKDAGLTDINVCAYLEDGQKCQKFSINCLDEVEGRKVYIVPNNDEYHYSEDCPEGDSIATTYHFVSSKGIKPCEICTK